MKILVINCGSSSIKYQLLDVTRGEPRRTAHDLVLARGLLEKIGETGSTLHHESSQRKTESRLDVATHREGLRLIIETLLDRKIGVIKSLSEIYAVGHRVVHGGEEFVESTLITPEVIAAIEKFSDLAPLHNPPNLTGIRAAQEVLPDVPQVAVFDTSFHQTLPKHAYVYALPYELYEKYRVRKYGFHGTSHRYVALRAAAVLGKKLEETNLITCHLGNGCSITAIEHGRSVDTSMGLTPLEGLVMGTRSGDIDPAIIFYLADHGFSLDETNTILNKKSGLLGLSGKSNDMRDLIKEAKRGDDRSRLALKIFAYRVKKYIGSYLAALGTADAVVFTGGIGENAAAVREEILSGLETLGIILDRKKNARARGEADVSVPESRTRILIIPTNEEALIAHDAAVIASGKHSYS